MPKPKHSDCSAHRLVMVSALTMLFNTGFAVATLADERTAKDATDSAIERIKKQTEHVKSDWKRRGEEFARSEFRKGENEAATIQERARKDAELLRAAQRSGLSPSQLSALQEQADRSAEIARQNAEYTAEVGKSVAERRAQSTQQTADLLESQLRNPGSGNIRLNPVGTNLYIRNYQYKPVVPIQPLHASPLLDPRSASVQTTTRAALTSKTDSLSGKIKPGQSTTLDVRGDILKSPTGNKTH